MPQISTQEFERLPLRVHHFLAGVPLPVHFYICSPSLPSAGFATLSGIRRALRRECRELALKRLAYSGAPALGDGLHHPLPTILAMTVSSSLTRLTLSTQWVYIVNQGSFSMKTVFVSGGHAGLGLEAASQLAARKVNLVLAGRDLGKLYKVATELRERYRARVSTVELDLAALSSVRAATKAVRKGIAAGEFGAFEAFLCNAGAQFRRPISYSADGFEETFAINHLGHFLLINLLLDCVAERGRVVFTASGTHDPDTMDGKMVGPAVEPNAFALANEGKQGEKPISGGQRYATSKLCNVLFAYELDRRLRRAHRSISSIAFDPGLIPETGLARTAPAFAQWLIRTTLMKSFLKSIGVTMGSLPFSGKSLADIAVEPDFSEASGYYLQSRNGTLVKAQSSKSSYDEKIAAKLWRDSEQLVGLQASERPRTLYEDQRTDH